jgi:cobalt-zinc-cadmium efflux system membrane fusion protein
MHVDLLVYEKDLLKVKEGQTVHFVLTNQSNKEIEGTIFNVGKSFENETKTVAVHAHIEDKDALLIPGMYVNALIDIGSNEVKTLPEDAIVQAEGRSFIFLYEKENDEAEDPEQDGHSHGPEKTHFSRIEVKTGPSQLGYIQVTPLEKIHQGDKIVLSGAYYLQSHLQKEESGG